MHKFIFVYILITGVTLSAQNLTIHGSDPTEIRSRIDIVLAQITSLANSQFVGTSVLGEYAFTDWFLAGLDVPYVYARFEGRTSTGFGDIRLKLLASIYRTQQFELLKAIAGGIDVHLDTGDADRGTGIGQTIVIPNVAASLHLAEELLIIPRIRYLFSVKEHRNQIDEIRLDFDNVLAFPEEFWLSVMPELIYDITGVRRTTLNLQTTLGKMLSEKWGVAAVFRTNLAGEPRVDSRSYLSFRYLF